MCWHVGYDQAGRKMETCHVCFMAQLHGAETSAAGRYGKHVGWHMGQVCWAVGWASGLAMRFPWVHPRAVEGVCG